MSGTLWQWALGGTIFLLVMIWIELKGIARNLADHLEKSADRLEDIRKELCDRTGRLAEIQNNTDALSYLEGLRKRELARQTEAEMHEIEASVFGKGSSK